MTYSYQSDILTTKQAAELCVKKGIEITHSGIMTVGKSQGFARKNNKHWEFDITGVIDYIKSRNEKPAQGWVPIREAVLKVAISKKAIYALIESRKVSIKVFQNKNKKMMYIDVKQLKNVIKDFKKVG